MEDRDRDYNRPMMQPLIIKRRPTSRQSKTVAQQSKRSREINMAVWSVKIVPGATPGAPATFVPQNQPNVPPGTLFADQGDIVSWDNTTGQDHQPVQSNLTLPLGSLMWPPVTPGHQTAAWVVAGNPGTTIAYTCFLHPAEQGTVVVTPIPAAHRAGPKR
jgi:hypothetical protein